MKVLLVSANTERINMPVLPLGLACVARALETAGHDVESINLMASADADRELIETLQRNEPEVIGVSIRNIDDQSSSAPRLLIEPVKKWIGLIRQHSRAAIVLGGAGYSIFPREILVYLGVDMGIRGEGEQAFPLLLDRLDSGGTLTDIAGLTCLSRGIANPPAIQRDLDGFLLPEPSRQFFTIDTVQGEPVWLPVQTRRGCPMNCSYCSTASIEGRLIRKRRVSRVIESLQGFKAAGFDHFYFVDNTFNLPPGYARELCAAMQSAHLAIAWRCILYPWKIDRELVARMAAAGCTEVSLGFESGCDELLAAMNKRCRTGDIRRAASLLKEYGIRRMGFLMLGLPGEREATVRQSLEFADSLDLEMIKITIGARIYPDTPLAVHARRTGVLSVHDTLLQPQFYIESGLEAWIRRIVATWLEKRPNWIC